MFRAVEVALDSTKPFCYTVSQVADDRDEKPKTKPAASLQLLTERKIMKFHRSLLQPVLNALAQHGIELMQNPASKGTQQTIEFLRDDPKLSVLKTIQAVKKQLKLPADSVTTYKEMPVLVYDVDDFRFELTFTPDDEIEIEQIEIEPKESTSKKAAKDEEPPRRGRNRDKNEEKPKTSKHKSQQDDDDEGEDFDVSMFNDDDDESLKESKRSSRKAKDEEPPRRGRKQAEESSKKSKGEELDKVSNQRRRNRELGEEKPVSSRNEKRSSRNKDADYSKSSDETSGGRKKVQLDEMTVEVDKDFKRKSSKTPSKATLLQLREQLLANLYAVEEQLQKM